MILAAWQEIDSARVPVRGSGDYRQHPQPRPLAIPQGQDIIMPLPIPMPAMEPLPIPMPPMEPLPMDMLEWSADDP
jgi:hypothetical protein